MPRSSFRGGDNVVAVDLSNSDRAAKFTLELSLINTTQDSAMLVMSDGQANRNGGCTQNTGDPPTDAVQAACDAREDYGITVYALGYSDAAEETTLQGIADCGAGIYKKSSNTPELGEFYNDVAYSIIDASVQSQAVFI